MLTNILEYRLETTRTNEKTFNEKCIIWYIYNASVEVLMKICCNFMNL